MSSTLTLQSDVTQREVDRAVEIMGLVAQGQHEATCYKQALIKFRAARGILTPVDRADVVAAVRRRGSTIASQRDLESAWWDILRDDLARVTHPARGGEGGTR